MSDKITKTIDLPYSRRALAQLWEEKCAEFDKCDHELRMAQKHIKYLQEQYEKFERLYHNECIKFDRLHREVSARRKWEAK